MKPGALIRMQRALDAAKRAEMARLAAAVAEAGWHRAEAARLLGAAAEPAAEPAGSAFDLSARAGWRRHLTDRAAEAAGQARVADQRAEALRADLARALGRELAVSRLIERNRIAERRRAERAG